MDQLHPHTQFIDPSLAASLLHLRTNPKQPTFPIGANLCKLNRRLGAKSGLAVWRFPIDLSSVRAQRKWLCFIPSNIAVQVYFMRTVAASKSLIFIGRSGEPA
eukprot:Gb_06548 [translate_table: standard]